MAIFEIMREEDGTPVDMVIRDVNNAYIEYVGFPRDKVLNQRASVIYGQEFIDQYFKLVQSDSEIGKGKQFETYYPPLDKYYLTTLFKIGKDLYATHGVDITRRVTLEKQLKNERSNLEIKVQERTKELLENKMKLIEAQKIAKLGNWELDLKTNELWFSDEIYGIFGYDPKTVSPEIDFNELNITYDILLDVIVHPDDKEFLNKSFKEALSGKKPYNIDHRIILPNGEERIIHEQAELIYDAEGNPVKMMGTTQDVTELKKTENALREGEEKFRQIAETIEEVFWIIDTKMNKIIYISPAYEKIWGLTCESLYENPKSWIDSIHPEDRERAMKILFDKTQDVYVGEKNLEYRIIRPDNEIRWISGKGFPIINESGEAYRIVGIARDITKLKKAENDLRESEGKFREIFNKANDMISLNEMNDGFPGKFIEVNEVGFNRLGYSREEMLKMGPKDIVAEDKRAEMPKNAAKLIRDSCNTFEIAHVTKNGRIIPVEINNHLINYKGREVCLAISRDITERKQMEEALKESEEKFREIFNKANDMITLGELKDDGLPGKYIEVNEVGLRRLGYTKEEFLNMDPLRIIAPERRKDVAKYAVEIWTKGHATFEMVHVTKTGQKIPVEVSTHIFKKNGKNVILAVSRDITERKESEKKLKELLEKLSTSNEELEQFAYIISHDLQEPLRTIANFTQLLQRRYEGKFDSDADEFMEYIVDASIRMKEMIHDLLEYSRVSTSKEELKPLNLNELIEDVLNDLKFTIEENNALIIHEELPVVIGVYDQLFRVFMNFISNALKFKKENETPKITISAIEDKKSNEYIIRVNDNGIGIDKQYLDRIFEIFQRLHTRDKYKGSGIGLAITKKIIEMHGGRIWVESEHGVGSSFYFSLPMQQT